MRNYVITALIVLFVVLAGTAYGQSVSQWTIPGTKSIQGLDALFPENPYNFVYFTEYDQMKIGMLSGISGGSAQLAEWLPIGAFNGFHPFKIVAGKWNFYSRNNPTLVSVPPFLNPPPDVKPKDLTNFINLGFRIWSIATFTMPDDNAIGMLIGNPFGPGPDFFWIWYPATSSGLVHPWDIKRRSIGADEQSAWVSNREPQQALYQFFPTQMTMQKWDLSGPKVEVVVFYVVPSAITKAVTEIWIGGHHSNAAGLVSDCIVYMKVDKKNSFAALAIWDLPTSTQPRTMNSILFTHAPTKTGFTNSQVWLSSATVPEMTILEPNSLFRKNAVDSLCFTDAPTYASPNGLFWNDPVFTAPAGADNARRIWITSQDTAPATAPGAPGMLTANKGNVTILVKAVLNAVQPKPFDVRREIVKAERVERNLYDSSAAQSKNDIVMCNTERVIWDNTTGLNVDFTGALLDINMEGKAASVAGNPGFNYTVIWHEPTVGRIGMLWSTPPITRTIFESGYDVQPPQEEPDRFNLDQNYPNPFNPSTTIDYMLPSDARVTLKVYNTLGQEVATLINNEVVTAGAQSALFNSSNLPSGVYFYRIQAHEVAGKNGAAPASLVDVKKMILLK